MRRGRQAEEVIRLASPTKRTRPCGADFKGDEMKTDGTTNDRDREATAPPGGMAIRDESQPIGRLTFAVFVVAELLCTGALIAWVAL